MDYVIAVLSIALCHRGTTSMVYQPKICMLQAILCLTGAIW